MLNVCDGVDHCGDASDEGYWHARCPGTFTVSNQQIVRKFFSFGKQ